MLLDMKIIIEIVQIGDCQPHKIEKTTSEILSLIITDLNLKREDFLIPIKYFLGSENIFYKPGIFKEIFISLVRFWRFFLTQTTFVDFATTVQKNHKKNSAWHASM